MAKFWRKYIIKLGVNICIILFYNIYINIIFILFLFYFWSNFGVMKYLIWRKLIYCKEFDLNIYFGVVKNYYI